MTWPWVSRSLLEQDRMALAILSGDNAGLNKIITVLRQQAGGLAAELGRVQGELDAAISAKKSLLLHCREIETKLADATTPPISSEDLGATLKRLSFLQAENEALRVANAEITNRKTVVKPEPAAAVPHPFGNGL
jgi:hypothetical protein